MGSPLGGFVEKRRKERGFERRGQLCRILRPGCSPRVLGKLGGKLHALETTGDAEPGFLAEVVTALGIGAEEMAPLLAEENRLREERLARDLTAWNAWADEPIRPYLILVPIPGINVHERIPDEAILSREAAEAWALERVRGGRAALVWSRRQTTWIAGKAIWRTEARPEVPNEPYAIVRGKRVVLEMSR